MTTSFIRFIFAAALGLLMANNCFAQSLAIQSNGYKIDGRIEQPSPVLASAKTIAGEPGERATFVITGQVISPFGPLAGAYIKLLDYPGSVVANAEGEFTLTAPDVTEKVRAIVSYAGFPDEAILLPLHKAYLTLEPWQGDELKAMGVRFKNNRLKQGATLPE